MDANDGAAVRLLVKGYALTVDREDEARVSSIVWQLSPSKSGRMHFTSPLVGRLSRWLLDAPDGMHVDHINGNTLDNRKCNLRICTHQQNQWNRKKAPGMCRFKGVTFFKRAARSCCWVARIESNGKRQFLGGFATTLEAAIAYDDAAATLFGRYAGLNFPERFRQLGEPNPDACIRSRSNRRWITKKAT